MDGLEKKVYKVGKNLAMFRVPSANFSVLPVVYCVLFNHGSSMIVIGYQLVKIKNISMCNWPLILLAISAFLWPIKAQRPPVTTTETETRTVFVTVDVNSNVSFMELYIMNEFLYFIYSVEVCLRQIS